MLAEFSVIPIGIGSSLGAQLAEVLKIVDASGLPYKLNPMGTVVEGEWDEIMKLVKKCHAAVMKTKHRDSPNLPVKPNLTVSYVSPLGIAAPMRMASVARLFYQPDF